MDRYKQYCGYATATFFKYYYWYEVVRPLYIAGGGPEDGYPIPDFWQSGKTDRARGYPTLIPIPFGSDDP